MNLQDTFKYLDMFSPSRTLLPILESACIHNGYIKATNLEDTIMIKTDIKESACIPLVVVKKALAKCKKLSPTLSLEGHDAVITHSKGSMSFQGESVDYYPTLAPIFAGNDPLKTIELSDEVMSAINVARSFNGKDGLREALCNVMLQDDAVVATNAHKLYWKDHKPLGIEDIGIRSAKGVDVARVIVELGLNHVQRFDDENAVFTNADRSVIVYSTNSFAACKYPAWRNVLPGQDVRYQATLKTKDLIESIDRLLIVANKATHQVVMNCNGSLELSAEDLDFNNKAQEKIECESSGSDIRIGVSGKLLSECLKLAGDTCTLKMYEPNRAIIINDEMLCMPIMLNSY